jgi:molybdate transport system ATP-binding protein
VTRWLRHVVLQVDVEVDCVTALVGPSGAGKSTLLRMVAGLLPPDSGTIECDGERWFGDGRDVPPERRRCGFVFQDYALFPHMTVERNVAYGAHGADVRPLLERVGIPHLASARPPSLSGGERQRVALARALAIEPRALLLDEPLSALDPATRGAVASELSAILHDAGVPTIVVTHSYEEAVSLAERVVVLESGRIIQQGAPQELLEAPASPFVAEFAGTNYLPGMASGSTVALDRGGAVEIAGEAYGRVAVLIAPWEITLAHQRPDDSARNSIHGTIDRVVPFGNRVRVVLAGVTAEITPESADRLALRPGVEAVASWKATSTRLVLTGQTIDSTPPHV